MKTRLIITNLIIISVIMFGMTALVPTARAITSDECIAAGGDVIPDGTCDGGSYDGAIITDPAGTNPVVGGVDPVVGGTNPVAGWTSPYDSGIGSLCDLINFFLTIVTEIGAVVGVLFIIWSGFLFIKAQGNEAEVKQAKSAFYTTIIGLAILLGASVIAQVIFNTVTSIITLPGGVCQ